MQDVLGENRQQRGGAAQQHREKIQGDHAEHIRSSANEMHAGKQRLECGRFASRRRLFVAQASHQDRRCQIQQAADHVDGARSGDVEKAAYGRAHDHRRLTRRTAGRHGARKQRSWHECRQHGLKGGELEGLGHTDQKDQRENARLMRKVREADGGEYCNRHQFHELSQHHDASALKLVGNMTGWQGEHHRGKELHQSDQAKIECATSDGVYLPAHCHRQHLEAEARGDARKPELDEGGMRAQRFRRRSGDGGGHRGVLA